MATRITNTIRTIRLVVPRVVVLEFPITPVTLGRLVVDEEVVVVEEAADCVVIIVVVVVVSLV